MKKYKYYSDPGHSWLQVPFTEIMRLNLVNKISAWSYSNGANLYLEEDCDAPLFLQAKKDMTGEPVQYVEYYTDQESPIRNFRPYSLGTGYD